MQFARRIDRLTTELSQECSSQDGLTDWQQTFLKNAVCKTQFPEIANFSRIQIANIANRRCKEWRTRAGMKSDNEPCARPKFIIQAWSPITHSKQLGDTEMMRHSQTNNTAMRSLASLPDNVSKMSFSKKVKWYNRIQYKIRPRPRRVSLYIFSLLNPVFLFLQLGNRDHASKWSQTSRLIVSV